MKYGDPARQPLLGGGDGGGDVGIPTEAVDFLRCCCYLVFRYFDLLRANDVRVALAEKIA